MESPKTDTPRSGQPLYNGQKPCPQRVRYSETPLYIYIYIRIYITKSQLLSVCLSAKKMKWNVESNFAFPKLLLVVVAMISDRSSLFLVLIRKVNTFDKT